MAIEWSNKKGFDATWDNLLASVDPSAVEFMVKIGENGCKVCKRAWIISGSNRKLAPFDRFYSSSGR